MIYSITKNNHIINIIDQDFSQGQPIYKSLLIDCNYPIEINKDNQMSFINANNQSKDVYQFYSPKDVKKFLRYYHLQQYGCNGCKNKSIYCFGATLFIILSMLGCFMLINNNHTAQLKSQNRIASTETSFESTQPQITQEKMDSLTTDFFLQEANKIRQQQQSSLLPIQSQPLQVPPEQESAINNGQNSDVPSVGSESTVSSGIAGITTTREAAQSSVSPHSNSVHTPDHTHAPQVEVNTVSDDEFLKNLNVITQ